MLHLAVLPARETPYLPIEPFNAFETAIVVIVIAHLLTYLSIRKQIRSHK